MQRIKVFAILMISILLISFVNADTTGDKFPRTVAQSNYVDNGVPWINLNNIKADDNTPASIISDSTSDSLEATNFDFSAIPDGATIDGIVVKIKKWASGGSLYDNEVRLTKDGTTAVGDDKSTGGLWNPVVYQIVTYGGANDLWGTTWTVAEIKASTFGSFLVADGTFFPFPPFISQGDVDFITINVYYTATCWTFENDRYTVPPDCTLNINSEGVFS